MSANTRKPELVDREIIYHKLQLLSTVVGLMEKNDGTFGDDDFFAMARFLSDIAHEVYPEQRQENS